MCPVAVFDLLQLINKLYYTFIVEIYTLNENKFIIIVKYIYY